MTNDEITEHLQTIAAGDANDFLRELAAAILAQWAPKARRGISHARTPFDAQVER